MILTKTDNYLRCYFGAYSIANIWKIKQMDVYRIEKIINLYNG